MNFLQIFKVNLILNKKMNFEEKKNIENKNEKIPKMGLDYWNFLRRNWIKVNNLFFKYLYK